MGLNPNMTATQVKTIENHNDSSYQNVLFKCLEVQDNMILCEVIANTSNFTFMNKFLMNSKRYVCTTVSKSFAQIMIDSENQKLEKLNQSKH